MVYELFDQHVVSFLALVAGTSCVCPLLWLSFVGNNVANPTVWVGRSTIKILSAEPGTDCGELQALIFATCSDNPGTSGVRPDRAAREHSIRLYRLHYREATIWPDSSGC